ncbi:hypothetical protein [Streptomyces sp. NPDC003635]
MLSPTSAHLPHLRLQDALAGDRCLLCSEGLATVIPDRRIRELLATAAGPDVAARSLIDAANAAGGPDDVGCVVADVAQRTASSRAG